ncbi:MAG: B12-binding domain-containing radical SAM protein [Nitrospirae bacterium]|nr:B12-binding domain-containing radical SAM protein [Nitrospirota bacterium]
MNKTDVLFIHPGNHQKTYQDLSGEYTATATPVWTLLNAQYIREAGFSTRLYDVNVEGWNDNTASALLSHYNPELIVMMVYGHNPSASTQTMPAAGRIAGDIKRANDAVPLAMGGMHPSALPGRTITEEAVDFVIIGEGPRTIKGLINCLKGRGGLHDIRGLCYNGRSAGITVNPIADIIEDLDAQLTGYAWDLLPPLTSYRAHNMHCFQDFEGSTKEDFSDVRSPYVAMNTSLGCPYNCTFCCINSVFGRPGIRYWSLDTVFSWIDELVIKYKVRNIRLDDELFILSAERVERFCDMMIERGHDVNLWVYGRVDTIEERLLKKMKHAGINWICLGIESANEGVRKDVNKKIHKDIKAVVRMIQANDIYVLGNFMFGLPEDNISTMEETLRLATELNCEFANFYSVMAYPGSELYNKTAKEHLPDTLNGYAQLGVDTKPLPTKFLTSAEVLRFRDEAFYTYHANPLYLDMAQRRFGGKVRRHIEKMLGCKIKRKLLGD